MTEYKKYLITWIAQGNEGPESHHLIADEYSVIDKINELAKRKGAWGNTDFHCYELGKEISVELATIVKINIEG
jgi:hypothetical protein